MSAGLLKENGNNIRPFKLSDAFLDKYKNIRPPFGFNGLGEFVYMRTYSRVKENGSNEQWYETIQRVVEGTYTIQKRWIEQHGLGWNAWQAQKSAQEMYDRMFNMKFLPPGRGLWAMGTSIVEEKGLAAALNNCGFVSTIDMKDDPAKPFCFLMDMSMLGVGVGFDTKGAGSITISGQDKSKEIEYIIPDTREGWVESLRVLIESFFLNKPQIKFDYSLIRKKGESIKTFGGKASGPEPLIELHESVAALLGDNEGKEITSTMIVDIQNMIGRAVVAGNVRRTAEIAFGELHDSEFLKLKDYNWNSETNQYEGYSAHRASYGWASNNSLFAQIGMDYSEVGMQTALNGEPGYAWLENMQNFSRMNGEPDYKDVRVAGGNPCLEQSLESWELCCLVETFPNRCENKSDFLRTLKFAYLYAKTVTLLKTHWAETNRVLLRNRRIGCSISGIAQFITNKSLNDLKDWCESGYETIESWDLKYSDWLAVPKSIKKTSIKPSGTISLLVGATPGVHFPEFKYYIRRVTVAKNSDLMEAIAKAGYRYEDSVSDKSAYIVEFPVYIGNGIRTASEVSMWEKLALAAFMQKYWADNQVSCTVTFDPETEASSIPFALDYYQYQLKGISFLPQLKVGGKYAQMPYEGITEEEYNNRVSEIKVMDLSIVKHNQAVVEKFCDGDTCEISFDAKES